MGKNSFSEDEFKKLVERLSQRKNEFERRIPINIVRESLTELGLLEQLRENDIEEVSKEVSKEFKRQQRRNYFNFALVLIVLATFGGYRLAAFLAFNFPNTAASLPQGLAINVNPQIVTDIKVQTSELEKELEDEKEESQEKDENINKLQEDLTALEIQLKVERENINKKDENINKLQQEITRLQKELTALNNKPKEVPSIPEETTQTNSYQTRANLKPDKERYTDLENILVNFYFENLDNAKGYRIQLVPSNSRYNAYDGPRIDVGENDNSVKFAPRKPGRYEIRAGIQTGTQWKLIETKPIEVTEAPAYRAE